MYVYMYIYINMYLCVCGEGGCACVCKLNNIYTNLNTQNTENKMLEIKILA